MAQTTQFTRELLTLIASHSGKLEKIKKRLFSLIISLHKITQLFIKGKISCIVKIMDKIGLEMKRFLDTKDRS